jgi:hypothetical protein
MRPWVSPNNAKKKTKRNKKKKGDRIPATWEAEIRRTAV